MGKLSKITWTHHTFNPWWGCQRVSPGCQNCYAEAFAKRTGNKVWGPNTPRRLLSDSHWNEPLKWNREAEAAGERHRVFCASMADVFEDRRDLDKLRQRLWALIDATPWLDWLLLTKRPENFQKLGDLAMARCWLGTTAEDQSRFDQRVEHLLSVEAAVHFLSCEPLLGPINAASHLVKSIGIHTSLDIDYALNQERRWLRCITEDGRRLSEKEAEEKLRELKESGAEVAIMGECDDFDPKVGCRGHKSPSIDWVIGGSESGPRARPMEIAWLESLRDQCAQAGVPFFTKQIANKSDRKGEKHPELWPGGADAWPRQFPEASP